MSFSALAASSSTKARHLESPSNSGTVRCTERKISGHSRRERKPSTSEREKAETCLEVNDECRLKKAVKRKESKESEKVKKTTWEAKPTQVAVSMAAAHQKRTDNVAMRKQGSERDHQGHQSSQVEEGKAWLGSKLQDIVCFI
ncbi:hypothetical protein C8J56DRAFT_1174095 [Mycena floridula]|nr:hypothetical protein C8J56DRAFT_1174095 [Mycena floridula]